MATLKGIWVFNDVLSFPGEAFYENFNYLCEEFADETLFQIGVGSDSLVFAGRGDYYVYYDGSWETTYYSEDVKTIAIPNDSEVSAEFYTWLTANATQQTTEEEEPTTSAVTVEYNDTVVATIPSGNKATIPVADKKLKTDIVITVPKAEGGTDSPLPTEVSTEAEMTALLTSGEVGGVYKYTGTTGTYENGALYVLEATADNSFTLEVWGYDSGTFTFNYVSGMTWAEFVDSEYNTNAEGTPVFTHHLSSGQIGIEASALGLSGGYASTALSYNRTSSYNVNATMKVGDYATYYYYTYKSAGSN